MLLSRLVLLDLPHIHHLLQPLQPRMQIASVAEVELVSGPGHGHVQHALLPSLVLYEVASEVAGFLSFLSWLELTRT